MDTAHNEFVGGTNYTDSITVAAADGTTQVVTVTIAGTDDAPVLTVGSSGVVTDTSTNTSTSNTYQNLSGTFSMTDIDSNTSSYTYDITGSVKANNYTSGSVTYDLKLADSVTLGTGSSRVTYNLGTLYLNSVSGQYTYEADGVVINNLPGTYSENRSYTFEINSGNTVLASKTWTIQFTGNATPVTFDMNHDGVITYLNTDQGVMYDYNNDGIKEHTAWVGPSDGILALEQDDGSVKFVFSTQKGETDLQGLAKEYDSNHDNILDQQDVGFEKFGVWQDQNSDAVLNNGEFITLKDLGISQLNLISDGIQKVEAAGDVIIAGQTSYIKEDGTKGLAHDASFAIKQADLLSDATTGKISLGEPEINSELKPKEEIAPAKPVLLDSNIDHTITTEPIKIEIPYVDPNTN